jgi:quercetin dioxygenase-like cupin family protein
VASEKLPNVPGNTPSAVVVTFAPGAQSSRHRPTSAASCVWISCDALEELGTGPAKVYEAGKSFLEPPGNEHLVSEKCRRH